MRRQRQCTSVVGYFTGEEYTIAYREAERELHVPQRAKRRGQFTRGRQAMGTRIHMRALQILWLRRALGSTYGRNEG
jgi:hypothetical protein